MRKQLLTKKHILLAIVVFLALAGITMALPPVRQRVTIYASLARARIKYALQPPEQQVFTPQGDPVATIVQATLAAHQATVQAAATATPSPTATPTGMPTATPTITPSPTPSPTPLPPRVRLRGVRHEAQLWNNCGPATLSMALSYWGWQGSQVTAAEYLKPNQRDKNVSPYEMEAFVTEKTFYGFLWRMGGDLRLLKTLLVNEYPVMVEKGFQGRGFEGWMGHYELLIGYDDTKGVFITEDSYLGENLEVPYDQFRDEWRAFNYIFLIPYNKFVEEDLYQILGPWKDEKWSYSHALEIARAETEQVHGQNLFFAWYNVGTSHVRLHEYADAAYAYDQAFAIYAQLPEEERPWRMLWYQTGPYFAYYYSGRYQDVINLATSTLSNMSEPILEESYYWRALAEEALGQHDKAIADLEEAVRLNPNFWVGWSKLRALKGGE